MIRSNIIALFVSALFLSCHTDETDTECTGAGQCANDERDAETDMPDHFDTQDEDEQENATDSQTQADNVTTQDSRIRTDSVRDCPHAVLKVEKPSWGALAVRWDEGISGMDTIVEVEPNDVIQLDATSYSYSPHEVPLSFHWELVEKPEDSVAHFEPSATTSQPTMTFDLEGKYVIHLVAFDPYVVQSCNTPRVEVICREGASSLLIDLDWNAYSSSEVCGGCEVNLDLHLLINDPHAQWNESPYDCCWHNENPNWGNPNSTEDDPKLEYREAAYGYDEEFITLESSFGGEYHIGAHYDSGNGSPATAWVRVEVGGWPIVRWPSMAEDWQRLELDEFWFIGTLVWEDGVPQVRHVDLVCTGFP